METLRDDEQTRTSRSILIQYLNDNGLDGESILSITRQAEPVIYEPDEAVLLQGKQHPYVSFLVTGAVSVYARMEGQYRELGERGSVCVLGEIGYFNNSAPTADVVVRGPEPAIVFRLTYDQMTDIITNYPSVKENLDNIGAMRQISQSNGFADYTFFLDLIGGKRQRFLLDHQVLPHVEQVLKKEVQPRLGRNKRMLEVGDGPGILSELLAEMAPKSLKQFHVQASNMEAAIVDPYTPIPSDLGRARYLRQTFDMLLALQVFNMIPAESVMEQFRIARGLIEPGGHLIVFKVRLVNVSYAIGSSETHLFFELLESLVDRAWPGIRGKEPVIHTTFLDADMDALMGWNHAICRRAAADELEIPDSLETHNRELLAMLLDQAKHTIFSPDALHFNWLVSKASGIGFSLESSDQFPDLGFYYQVYVRE